MVHSNNLVVSLKCGNKFASDKRDSEGNNVVRIPFNTEYKIYLKNLNRENAAVVDISIDGREAVNQLIVNPNSIIELERFVENNLSSGYKFKFIEKTKKIEEFRGNNPEDGLIVINYRFEIDPPRFVPLDHNDKNWDDISRHFTHFNLKDDTKISGKLNQDFAYFNEVAMSTNDYTEKVLYSPANNDGITVEGSVSNQEFKFVNTRILEDKVYTIVIKMYGYDQIEEDIRIAKQKTIICDICGTKVASTDKFCRECGKNILAIK